MRIVVIAMLLSVSFVLPICAHAEESEYLPTRYGMSLLTGRSYTDNIGMVVVQAHMIADYKRFFVHRSPEGLRLKIEANLGLTTDGRQRTMFSLNMMALRYLDSWQIKTFLPYFEAGIGVIYTDFRVEGQGSRLNFNPQLGVGLQHQMQSGDALTVGLRLHHISNANFLKKNHGVDTVFLMLGYLF